MSDVDRLLQAMHGPPAPSEPPQLPEEDEGVAPEGGSAGFVPWALAAAVLLGVGVLALAPNKPFSMGGESQTAAPTEAGPPGEGAAADAVADVDDEPEAEEVEEAVEPILAEEPAAAPKKVDAPEAEPAPAMERAPEPKSSRSSSSATRAEGGSASGASGGAMARLRPADCLSDGTPLVVSLNVVDGRIISLDADVETPVLPCLNEAMLGTPHPGSGVVEETISP
ncbi:MAG: hypothetical protein GY913_03465 [Proteobacteria bacterium]|nr:hypothetical protein [Pseudomonadota bacterium]MCP4915959.1 hypothetical protein [Pseudomonadota bacterium]